MESLWGNLQMFASDVKNPKEIMQEQASIFNNLEGNLALIKVVQKGLTDTGKRTFQKYGNDIQADFIYVFELGSEYLAEYTYDVFFVYYGIKFYPLCIQLSAGIEEELQEYLEEVECLDMAKHRYRIDNEKMFLEMLRRILSTEELGTIVRNINLLAKEQEQAGDIL